MDEILATVQEYILREFLPGEAPETLNESTPLVTGGILDSIATLRLVAFLEERYGIEFEAHEVTVDNLNRIADIARIVWTKMAPQHANG